VFVLPGVTVVSTKDKAVTAGATTEADQVTVTYVGPPTVAVTPVGAVGGPPSGGGGAA
jgi:hypothetical protein